MSSTWICPFCETQNSQQTHVCEVCGRADQVEIFQASKQGSVKKLGAFFAQSIVSKPKSPEVTTPEGEDGKDATAGWFIAVFLGVLVLVIVGVGLSGAMPKTDAKDLMPAVILGTIGITLLGLLAWGIATKSKTATEEPSHSTTNATSPLSRVNRLPSGQSIHQLALQGNEVWMITQSTHLEIWNAASGEKIKTQDLESSTPKMVLLQVPYLVEIACMGEQVEVGLFLLRQGLLSHVRSGFIRSEALPAGVAMHPKGAAIVLLNRDASLVGLDLRTPVSRPMNVPALPGEGVCAIAYGTQGKMVAAGHEDGTVSLMRSGNFELLHTCSGDSSEPISKLLFSPGDEWLVAHHKSGFLSCFRLSDNPTVPGFTYMVSDPILWMEFHPVQHRLMVLTAGEVLLLNLHLRRADGVVGVGPMPLVAVVGRENGDVMGLTDNGTLVRLQMPEELL